LIWNALIAPGGSARRSSSVAPLREIIAAGLANNPELTFEVEVFNAELKALSADAAAARVAGAVKALRQGLAQENKES
jgi:hypothetical protein